MKKILSMFLFLALVLPVAVSAENDENGFMRQPCTGGALYNSMTGEKCPTNGESNSVTTVAYNPSCASAAVIAQENSMQTIRETFEASMKTAVTLRRDALGAAYLLTDVSARQAAIKTARDAFRSAQQTAEKTRKDAEKALMDSFKTTMQGCGVRGEMMQGEMEDRGGFGEGMGQNMMNGEGKFKQENSGKKVNKKLPMKKLPKPFMMNENPNQGEGQPQNNQ